MAKTLAMVFGVFFVIVGILGWIPNPIAGRGALFDTNHIHDLIHILIGLALVVVAWMYADSSAMALKVFGVVYLLVAVLGYIMTPGSGEIFGLIHVNAADNMLHVVFGIVLIAAGFWAKDSAKAPMAAPSGGAPMGGCTPMGGGQPRV